MTQVVEKYGEIKGVRQLLAFDEAWQKRFPNLGIDYNRWGCGLKGGSIGWVCPACVRAEKVWMWRHRNSPARFLKGL